MHTYELAQALATTLLRPLASFTPRRRELFEQTLLAWLKWGAAPEVAKALQVHPQTVRYRMRQIEKVFGNALRDPDTRFAMELALRSRDLDAARTRMSRARPNGVSGQLMPQPWSPPQVRKNGG
ncbi:PucR family transcriptional regulator [Streptomyces sp. NPDC054887]